MQIPIDFKNAIAEAFYDKDLELYNISSELDTEGGEGESTLSKIKDFVGNAQINNNEYNLKEYGFEINANYKFSTHENVEFGQLIKYNSNYYKAIKILKMDSHNLIFGELYEY